MKAIIDAIQIESATYLKDYKIKFVFTDGYSKIIDFESFLKSDNTHPALKKFIDKELFRKFQIKRHMDITWNDYEMCFPFESIIEGRLD